MGETGGRNTLDNNGLRLLSLVSQGKGVLRNP